MTEINPCGWLQNAGSVHTAEQLRSYVGGILTGKTGATALISSGGVTPLGNQLVVTQTGTPSMAVVVKSGLIFVPGTEGSKQGVYACENDADVTLTIAASSPTNPRIDIVVAQVQDAFYSGVLNAWKLAVVTGTPAGVPAAPTAPVDSIVLAQVAVATNAATIVNANITDLRPFAAGLGGVITSLTDALRPSPSLIPAGSLVYSNAAGKLYLLNGSAAYDQVYPGFFKIGAQVLGSATPSVTFSGIPQNYTSLLLHVVARGDAAIAFASSGIRFNGDTAGNYDNEQVGGAGAVASAFEGLNVTSATIGEVAAASTVAGSCSMFSIAIPFYTQTSFWKPLTVQHMLMAQTSGGQAGQLFSKQWATRWRSTAAITSLSVVIFSGNFVAGSSFVLYGTP